MPAKTTVQIKPALLNKLKRYQTETGISITYCVEEAIGDWIESTMPMRLSALSQAARDQNQSSSLNSPAVQKRPARADLSQGGFLISVDPYRCVSEQIT